MSQNNSHSPDNSTHRRFAPRLLVGLLLFWMVLVSLHLLFQYLNLEVYKELHGQVFELSNRLDFDDESSLPTWFAQAQFLGIGVAALLAGFLQKDATSRRLWNIIACVALIFWVDEVAAIHEFILQFVHLLFYQEAIPTFLNNAWVLIIPFVLLFGLWLAYKMYQIFPRRTVVLFVFSATIFLIGAVGIDILTSTEMKHTFWSQGVLVAIEESLELLGTITMFYAVVDYLERYRVAPIRKAIAQLKAHQTE